VAGHVDQIYFILFRNDYVVKIRDASRFRVPALVRDVMPAARALPRGVGELPLSFFP
jgi:hypothetical protein